ncbi:AT-rich interactive domain-containing protein 4B [Galendromus occidentalis]|uniref:AT-rich interactive domain-containing protein 4B n=1 Tax=Galendromus occidentalis TaxID=34638 RepID=A0AAJ6QNX4_9ACAR|nr:AT-rich interactive domain-containing protein 4B [Galendromus occidentalis]
MSFVTILAVFDASSLFGSNLWSGLCGHKLRELILCPCSLANDEPPFLSVGTDVSAKYKGAFCEAKIKKVQRSVKCRLSFKSVMGGSVIVPDDHIRGNYKVGLTVEAKHPDKPSLFQEATVIKIIDQSQYTVVFDDGDVTTLRRTSLCLKSGKHYMDGESLDQLPLTNPEHFSAPVAPTAGNTGSSSNVGNSPAPGETRGAGAQAREQLGKSGMPPRKKRTAASLGEFLCREGGDASSQEEDEPETTPRRKRNQPTTNLTPRESRNRSAMSAGSVILIEVERKDEKPPRGSDTPRSKRDYVSAPALVLRDQSSIKRDEVRVKLFRDGQVMVVARKDATEFDRKLILKGNPQKSACSKALVYCEKGELPQGWSRKELLDEPADTEDDNEPDRAEEDDDNDDARDSGEDQEDEDETDPDEEVHDEEKDRFVAQLYKFMDERGTPINKAPVVNGKDLDLHQLFSSVQKIGSFDKVTNLNKWKDVYSKLFKEPKATPAQGQQLKSAYKKYLQGFEDLYRKLGMATTLDTKVSTSGGRSQRIMTRNKQLPVNVFKARDRKAVTPQPDSPTSSIGKNRDKDAGVDEEKRSVRKKIIEDKDAGAVTPKRIRSDSLDNSTRKAKEKAAAASAVKSSKEKEDKVVASNTVAGSTVAAAASSTAAVVGTGNNGGGSGAGAGAGPGAGGPKKKRDKNSDTEASESEATPLKKNIEPIRVNDRIKVKYGHGKQLKVYEAKVLKIEDADGDSTEKKYLVHYTGWNNRYDEWIQKKRILENITLKMDKGRGPGRKSAASAAEREKRLDDKDSSNSPSESKNEKAEGGSKRDRSIEKDTATSTSKKTRESAPKEKDEENNEEPRKRRGKLTKKFSEEPTSETSVQTRQKDQAPAKDNNPPKDGAKQKDEEVAKEKKPTEVIKDEKKDGATSTATAKTVKDEKKHSGPPSSSNESQGAAPVKKLVEVSPEQTARVFAVKSKPPESSPPPPTAATSCSPDAAATSATAATSAPLPAVPDVGPSIEKQAPFVAGTKRDRLELKKEKLVEVKKEKVDEESKDSPAQEKQASTPKRSRVTKRKKAGTPSSAAAVSTSTIAASVVPSPQPSAAPAPDSTTSGSSVPASSTAPTSTSVISTAIAAPQTEKTPATAAPPTAPSVSAKEAVPLESVSRESELQERVEAPVLASKTPAAVIPETLPSATSTTAPAATSSSAPVVPPKEEQSEGEDTDIEKDPIEPTIGGPSLTSLAQQPPPAAGAAAAAPSGVGVSDETTITQDDDDEQLMDLDESGVEAFDAEAAASSVESTPTTFANVTPLTSSTPRTNVVVENSTPVASKTRKPRGLKKVEEEEKEKKEETPSRVKEEKLPEEKKLPMAVKSRARKISEPPEEEPGNSRKRPRKTPEVAGGFASKLAAVQSPATVKESPVTESPKTSLVAAEVVKKPEPNDRTKIDADETLKPATPLPSSSSKSIFDEVKQKEKDGKEQKSDQPTTSFMTKKRKTLHKVDEESQPSPPSTPVIAKKTRVEELKQAEKVVKHEVVKDIDTESETSEEKVEAADNIGEVEERGEELKRREAERAAAGDVLASLASACGPKEPEQAGGLFLICEENVLPESPVPNNNNNQENNDVPGPAHAPEEDAAQNRAEISSACVTEVTPPTTPDDSQSSASNQNAPSNANNRRNAVGGQGSARGSEGPGPVDEESTMSADSSDSARPSAVEREREKAVRGKGGLGGAGRGRMKRTRKTLRQKAGQRRAERGSPDHHAGQRGEGRHVGLMCAQMPPNYDPVRPARYNFLLPIDENLDAEERIGIIQDRLCELKKTYLSLKSEIAVIDRKRKRLRRREAVLGTVASGSGNTAPGYAAR